MLITVPSALPEAVPVVKDPGVLRLFLVVRLLSKANSIPCLMADSRTASAAAAGREREMEKVTCKRDAGGAYSIP